MTPDDAAAPPAAPPIRVLGPVEIRHGGAVVVPPVQQAKVLAVLAAAEPGTAVERADLAHAVWGRGADDLLSPVLSRLRRLLAPTGVTVSPGRYEHALVPVADGGRPPAEVIDLHRFTDAAHDGAHLLAGGEVAAAGRRFADAAQLWRGEPFTLHGTDWDRPGPCRRAGDTALRVRARMLTDWAGAAVDGAGTGVGAVLAHLDAHPRLAAFDRAAELDDVAWLFTFLSRLRTSFADAARWRDTSGRPATDPLVLRADQLLQLEESGFPVLRAGGHPAPEPPARPEVAAAADRLAGLVSSPADGHRAPIAVDGPAGAGRTRVLAELAARTATTGTRVLRVPVVAEDPLAVWRTLAAALWTEALLALPVPDPWDPRIVATLADLVLTPGRSRAPSPSQLMLVRQALVHLVRERARHRPLVIALDDAHLLDDAGRTLLAGLCDGIGHVPACVVITRRTSGGERLGPATYRGDRELRDRVGLVPEPAPEVVAAACGTAAEVHRERHETTEALALARRGLEVLAGAGPPAPGQDRDGVRYRLLMTVGEVEHDRARMVAAADAYREAYRVAEGRPLDRGRAAVRLARRWSDPGRADGPLLGLLAQALDDLDGVPGDEAATLRLLLRAHRAHKATLAVTGASSGGAEQARAVLRELTAAAWPVAAPDAADVLVECRWALYDSVGPGELIALARRLDETADDEHFRGEACIALIIDELRCGRLDAALQALERHRTLTERTGRPFSRWLQSVMDGVVDLWRGEFDSAGARLSGENRLLLGELAVPGTVTSTDSLTQTHAGQVFWLHRELGTVDRLPALGVSDAAHRRTFFPVWWAAMALLHSEAGRPAVGADLAVGLLATTGVDDVPPHGWAVPTLVLVSELVSALFRSGTPLPMAGGLAGLAGRLEDRLERHGGEIALAGWPTVLLGPVSRSLGILALVRGEADAALARFAEAERQVAGSPPQWARLRVDQARALRAVGRDAEAVELLVLARAAARELGMTRLVTDAEGFLRAQGFLQQGPGTG